MTFPFWECNKRGIVIIREKRIRIFDPAGVVGLWLILIAINIRPRWGHGDDAECLFATNMPPLRGLGGCGGDRFLQTCHPFGVWRVFGECVFYYDVVSTGFWGCFVNVFSIMMSSPTGLVDFIFFLFIVLRA